MQKIRCLLVDDEPLALDAMATLTGKIPELEVIGRCKDAVEALQVIHQKKIDLLFLDIQMPELTGLEMLRSLTNPPKVIFTTAYREYAVEAFELDVVDYLVKPVSLERLLKSINRYHDRIRTNSNDKQGVETDVSITIYSDKKTHKIDTSEILFIEGLKDYALVHTKSNRIITRQTMKNFEALLSSYDFIRVHRSWIVPYRRVSSWTSYSVNIGEKEVPIGKTYRKAIQKYLENKHR
ncbi:MAG TPA: response regulator transcription factor [Bacteroides sp.]|nr:response regulator transcription factor [Bacteroides sp.]